jgi:hypothetical protein
VTKLQQLKTIIDGLDDKGPDYLAVREAKKLVHDMADES